MSEKALRIKRVIYIYIVMKNGCQDIIILGEHFILENKLVLLCASECYSFIRLSGKNVLLKEWDPLCVHNTHKKSMMSGIRLRSLQITVLEKGPSPLIPEFLTGCVLHALPHRLQIRQFEIWSAGCASENHKSAIRLNYHPSLIAGLLYIHM